MKVEKHVATFEFLFNGITTQKESYDLLAKFLMENRWINEYGYKSPEIHSRHSDKNGVCEVIFIGTSQQNIEDICDDFFDNLWECKEVKWAKVIYNDATEKLVYNHADKYAINLPIWQNAEKGKSEFYVIYR